MFSKLLKTTRPKHIKNKKQLHQQNSYKHRRFSGLLTAPLLNPDLPTQFQTYFIYFSLHPAALYVMCMYKTHTYIKIYINLVLREKSPQRQHPVDSKSIYFNLIFICNGFLGCSHQGNILAGGKEWKHITFVFNGSYALCSFDFPIQKCLQSPWNMTGIGTDLWCKLRSAQLRTL